MGCGVSLNNRPVRDAHDNNRREAQAIPHYEAALALGLDTATRTKCLAWLASSLYKTGHPAVAMSRAREAVELSQDPELSRVIVGLRRRIERGQTIR